MVIFDHMERPRSDREIKTSRSSDRPIAPRHDEKIAIVREHAHRARQTALLLNARSTGLKSSPALRAPRPEATKSSSVPVDYGFRLHHHEHLSPARPHAPMRGPEKSVAS